MMPGRIRVCFLWLSDAICLAAVWAVVAAAYQLSGLGMYRLEDYFDYWPLILVFTGINSIARLYLGRGLYPAMPLSEVEEFRRLVLSSVATHALLMAFLGFNRGQEEVSRVVLCVSGLMVAFLAQPFRYAFRLVMFRLRIGQIPCFVVGEGPAADRMVSSLESSAYYGFSVVRHFHRDDLREIIAAGVEAGVHHLFACYRDDRLFKVQFPDFARQFTFIEYLPTTESFPTSGAQVIQIGGLGGLEMTNPRQLKLLTVEKSILDRALACVIFLFSSPLFLIIPVLVKLTSPGPVFYRAKRLGKKGRTIYVWKFRSMYADADRRLQAMLDASPALRQEFERDFKLKNDPRVTPLGHFMRKTSIDELPQLLNVLTHDMSLIGPRPIVEKEVPKYGKAYEIFSSVKPGITGLWQASGRSDCSYEERVALDVHYILNWSPWMDLWIVFRTAAAVLKMKGSY